MLDYLKKTLAPYRGKVQNVVLGCTHYPLAKAQIQAVLGDVAFFDGAPGIARRLKYLLEKNGMLNESEKAGNTEFTDSSEDPQTRKEKAARFYRILNADLR